MELSRWPLETIAGKALLRGGWAEHPARGQKVRHVTRRETGVRELSGNAIRRPETRFSWPHQPSSFARRAACDLPNSSIYAPAHRRSSIGKTLLMVVSLMSLNPATLALASTPPRLEILLPTRSPAYSTTEETMVVAGKAQVGSTPRSFTWRTNHGHTGPVYGGLAWSTSIIPLELGANEITVELCDHEGLMASASVTVTRTVTHPPGLLLLTPGAEPQAERPTPYRVHHGLVVVDDVILGPAEILNSAAKSQRRDAAFVDGLLGRYPWPSGEIPFVFDVAVPQDLQNRVLQAMQEWSTKIPAIRFRPPNNWWSNNLVIYVISAPFQPDHATVGYVPLPGCNTMYLNRNAPLGTILHELGHVIGLFHEHQREDRDNYVTVDNDDPNVRDHPLDFQKENAFAKDLEYYDYGSIMHYGPYGIDARGIPIGQQRWVSDSDAASVSRAYGAPWSWTVVTTYPRDLSEIGTYLLGISGLSGPINLPLTIDGITLGAPSSFNWKIGEVHTLSAPMFWYVSTSAGLLRFRFARWNDTFTWEEAETWRTHAVTKSANYSVYVANYVPEACGEFVVQPAGAGSILFDPEPVADPSRSATERCFRLGKRVFLKAVAHPGCAFKRWSGHFSTTEPIVYYDARLTRIRATAEFECACSVTLSPPGRDHGAGAESGSLTVTAPQPCSWQARADQTWIQITGGTPGSGSGSVNYRVDPNGSPQPREGLIVIETSGASSNFIVRQVGSSADFTVSLSPEVLSVARGMVTWYTVTVRSLNGFSGAVTLSCWGVPGRCTFANTSVVSVTQGGSASVTMLVEPRLDVAPGSYSVVVQGTCGGWQRQGWATLEVTTPELKTSKANVSFVAASGATAGTPDKEHVVITSTGDSLSVRFIVSTQSGGDWLRFDKDNDATPVNVWVRAPARALPPGRYQGSIRVEAVGVSTAVEIHVSLSVVCTYSVSPSQAAFAGTGGLGQISVSTQPGCTWAPSVTVPWIALDSDQARSGSGTAQYTVSPNAGAARDGVIAVQTLAGNYTIWILQGAGEPPANDDSAGATTIRGLPYEVTQSTASATVNGADPEHSCTGSRDSNTVWFRLTANFTGRVRANTMGSDYDTVLAAYNGTNTPGAEVACNDNSGGTLQSLIEFPVSLGQTYWIEVSGRGQLGAGTLVLSVRGIAPGDYSFDGRQDLLWQNDSTRQVTVHYFQGASFSGWSWLNNGGIAGWRVVAASDFDGNGTPDLIWQNESTRQVTVHYFDGASFIGWNWLNAGSNPGWWVVAAADFNGDGKPDLVWQNETSRAVTVHYYAGAQGNQSTGWAWLSGGYPGWRVVAAADFDGNGTADLVWQNEITRQVTLHRYLGTSMTGWSTLLGGYAGWSVVGAGDYNGDGKPDLVWQNDGTRQVVVHYYTGTVGDQFSSWQWLNAGGIPGWRAVVPR